MKYLIFLVLFIAIFPSAIAGERVSDINEYLIKLDEEMIDLIKLLEAFNQVAGDLDAEIEGWNVYTNFLMEITLECSNIRKQIQQAQNAEDEQQRILLRKMLQNIKPDVKYAAVPIKDSESDNHFKLLELYYNRFRHFRINLSKKIIEEEKMILASGTFNKAYLDLHSRHFMLSLLNSFIKPAKYLDNKNMFLLLSIVKEIDEEFMKN